MIFQKIIEARISEKFDLFCKKRPSLGWALLILTVVLEGLIWVYFQYLSGSQTSASVDVDAEKMAGSVINAANINGNVTINNQSSSTTNETRGVDKQYVILDGYWKPDDKDSYAVNGKSILLLSENERLRFDYVQPNQFLL